jgi:hypothetical protein
LYLHDVIFVIPGVIAVLASPEGRLRWLALALAGWTLLNLRPLTPAELGTNPASLLIAVGVVLATWEAANLRRGRHAEPETPPVREPELMAAA